MKRMIVMALALSLLSTVVFAVGERTFSWQPPTEYDDNTPLANADIEEYRIYCDGINEPLAIVPNQPLNADQYDAPPGTFSVGPHACSATTVAGGIESAQSNIINFTVAPGIPKPPIFVLQ